MSVRKILVTIVVGAVAVTTAGRASAQTVAVQAASATAPTLTGTWSVTMGEWQSDEGIQINMGAGIAGLVFSMSGDTVIANYKMGTGPVSKQALKGRWVDGKLHLAADIAMKRQTKDADGNVQSETENGSIRFEIDLVPDAADLKGTFRLISDNVNASAPITAKREAL